MKISLSARLSKLRLIEDSPLRGLDPRTKIWIGLCASLMVMLPIERLLIFIALYLLFLGWARLLPATARQVWRLKWILLILFVLDALLVDLELAVTVTLRIAMLAGVFTLLFATTTPAEFTLALENLGLPYRYAFSLGLASQSLVLLEEEWNSILEAQRARGALRTWRSWRTSLGEGLRSGLQQVSDLVALTVPAVVLTTKRAWSITEAAYARGFDSPHRASYHRLRLIGRDFFAMGISLLTCAVFLFWQVIIDHL
jgi:energy-coupling factor transporter transmembrane protein EcfT